MRMVIALGGNALLRRSETMTTRTQRKNVEIAAQAIAPLISEHTVAIVHGNGPQVGLLGPKVEAANRFVRRTGGRAAIGGLADIAGIVKGQAGTNMVKGDSGAEVTDATGVSLQQAASGRSVQ